MLPAQVRPLAEMCGSRKKPIRSQRAIKPTMMTHKLAWTEVNKLYDCHVQLKCNLNAYLVLLMEVIIFTTNAQNIKHNKEIYKHLLE
jgi:hypothetical protein